MSADSPVALAGSPVALAGSPVALADSPVALADSPVALAGSPVALAGSPVVSVDSREALADSPVALAGSPVAWVDSPAAWVDSPAALAVSPVAWVDSPAASAVSPAAWADSPAAWADSPAALAVSPAAWEDFRAVSAAWGGSPVWVESLAACRAGLAPSPPVLAAKLSHIKPKPAGVSAGRLFRCSQFDFASLFSAFPDWIALQFDFAYLNGLKSNVSFKSGLQLCNSELQLSLHVHAPFELGKIELEK
ncbi:hypothetical protein [Cohnella candidum]|uniref:hypothetical protein n=1 Tax=Cohnella candidum TaxID=2674991 RepID=UPI0013DE0E61|nr:hypothetical protein [Cohnella candidum]